MNQQWEPARAEQKQRDTANLGSKENELAWATQILYLAAMLSLAAALIHAWVVPEHFEEWWGYGTFFLVVALAQGLYSLGLVRWPGQELFVLGIAGNLAIIVLYIVTRTAGIPLFGPHAGEVEEIGGIDLVSVIVELVLVIALVVLLRASRRSHAVERV